MSKSRAVSPLSVPLYWGPVSTHICMSLNHSNSTWDCAGAAWDQNRVFGYFKLCFYFLSKAMPVWWLAVATQESDRSNRTCCVLTSAPVRTEQQADLFLHRVDVGEKMSMFGLVCLGFLVLYPGFFIQNQPLKCLNSHLYTPRGCHRSASCSSYVLTHIYDKLTSTM